MHDQTIIAQCTPQGAGALALLRLSGDDAWVIADGISRLPAKKRLLDQPTHTIHYGHIVDETGAIIDQVLFLLMRGPHSFTGEDTVEITTHNNPLIIQATIAAAINRGARLAHAGEFSKRAVLNNKIDLLQAEAINELIGAQTQQALKQSLSQVEGTLSGWISSITDQLIHALALTQASFEFLDEENISFADQIEQIIKQVLGRIAELKKSFGYQNQLRSGIRIALIGSVNAGKSSLFNALLNSPRAIVSPQAGTTRDVIEATLQTDGINWLLIDTAGLRRTDDLIEHEGIRRSRIEAQKADIILLILDSSRTLSREEEIIYQELLAAHKEKIILVYNKIDCQKEPFPFADQSFLAISSQSRSNVDHLKQAIGTRAKQLFNQMPTTFLINERHHAIILRLENDLRALHQTMKVSIAYEIIAYHLQNAIALASELTGKSVSEAAMDQVFHHFCVGK